MLNKDYKEMLQSLLDLDVKFLVIGAYAMAVYGYIRATGDIDIWIMASHNNSEKIYKALKIFGAPMEQITEDAFAKEGTIFQLGVAPRRIDLITRIDGVDFEQAYSNRSEVVIDGINIPLISKENLIKNKENTGRAKDLLDAEKLRKLTEN